MGNFFAYGTLMCQDIMEDVSGCRLSYLAGVLRGYSRRAVKGEHYPALVPSENGYVEGVVYRNLPDSAWERLDRFEGEMYIRQLVRVELNDETNLLAATYVIHPEFKNHLEASGWNFTDFLRNGKNHFQKDYKGYKKL